MTENKPTVVAIHQDSAEGRSILVADRGRLLACGFADDIYWCECGWLADKGETRRVPSLASMCPHLRAYAERPHPEVIQEDA